VRDLRGGRGAFGLWEGFAVLGGLWVAGWRCGEGGGGMRRRRVVVIYLG